MVNYWAIAIGINQYQLFQPLSCAQADAEAIRDFLIKDAGFLRQNCLLMTNSSPPIGERYSYPTKENILLLLEELAAKFWQPGDYVWFFFSGYGVNYNNQDYLMPVEANPELIVETGIAVRSLMQSLEAAQVNPVLIFDINRAFGTQADAPVGQEIIEIAQELQIGAILSCQPEEFSHESTELGYGLFTAALLEALRCGQGSNLTNLSSYLSTITPKLCQHHWRPQQNPVIVAPKQSLTILPASVLTKEPEAIIFPEESFAIASPAQPSGDSSQKTSSPALDFWANNHHVETTLSPATPPNPDLVTSPELKTGGRFIPAADKIKPSRNQRKKNSLRKQFILWSGGSLAIVGLIAAFFLRNQDSFRFQQSTPVIENTPQVSSSPPVAVQPTPSPTPVADATLDAQKRNRALLELGKMSLQANQASDLSLAIATAKKIQPDQPLYEQAQENIQIWSQMILDLATARAKQKEYNNAIAAAQLISKDQTIYPQAQEAIERWRLEAKQYVSNMTLLDAANALIKPGQASTYNRAIEVAKKVPPGQPGYDTAQKSINQWSEKILELAKTRAAQGDLTTAVETANLVPEVTTAYEDAQDAIQKWQVRKMKN